MSEIRNVEFYLQRLLSCGAITIEDLKTLVAKMSGEAVSAPEPSGEEDEAFPQDVEVGWYAFAGGKFAPNPDAYPNCQGVVGWVNPDKSAPKGQRGLVVTPDSFCATWSDMGCVTGVLGNDGKRNTAALIAYGKAHGVSFPAAEWCVAYAKNGVKTGEGFLPAKKQLRLIIANREIINQALDKIGGVLLSGMFWSSSELDCSYAWEVYANDGRGGGGYKYGGDYVRCILAF